MRDVLNTTNIIMINQTINIEMENEYREVDNFSLDLHASFGSYNLNSH